MTLNVNVKDARFVIRSDATDPSFVRWGIVFDGQEYVSGTRPAPREEVESFIEWLKEHIAELAVTSTDERSSPESSEGRW